MIIHVRDLQTKWKTLEDLSMKMLAALLSECLLYYGDEIIEIIGVSV